MGDVPQGTTLHTFVKTNFTSNVGPEINEMNKVKGVTLGNVPIFPGGIPPWNADDRLPAESHGVYSPIVNKKRESFGYSYGRTAEASEKTIGGQNEKQTVYSHGYHCVSAFGHQDRGIRG